MNQHELEKLSNDELIVAVAEAKGWKLSKVARVNGQDVFIAVSPGGVNYTLLACDLPDYRQPSEYMALMDEVWDKKHGAEIGKFYITWLDKGIEKISCDKDTRWRAICIAWLMICGKENEDE